MNNVAKIDPDKLYKPMEIAKNRLLINSGSGELYSTYNFVLKLIASKRLPARDDRTGKVARYKVLGKELIDFINSRF